MKEYENISRNYLTRRVPVIIRLDGKAFHTFTKGMKKPFDRLLMTTMQETMKSLCENIQGCVFGYTYSGADGLCDHHNRCVVWIQHSKDVQHFRIHCYADI